MLETPTNLVTPAAWKKAMKVAGEDEGKEQCRALALQLFPACAASFALKRHHGRAEAALLALYAAQHLSRDVHGTPPDDRHGCSTCAPIAATTDPDPQAVPRP